jgi:hypothetical protein
MTDRNSATLCRQRAAELRKIATTTGGSRTELLLLAESYELLAASVENWIDGAPVDPPVVTSGTKRPN